VTDSRAAGGGRVLSRWLTPEVEGILWMLATGLLWASLDAVAKHLAQSYPVAQLTWARFALPGIALPILLGRQVVDALKSRRRGLQVLRALLVLVGTGFLFWALRYVPLADASAISFLNPLIVTALAMPLLGERVAGRQWAGVAAGFVGALVIIRPGTGAMHWAAFLVLCSSSLFALYHVATRYLSRSDAPLTTLLYTGLVTAAASTLLLPFVWVAPDAEGWALMAAMGLFNGLGTYTLIRAFAAAPAAVVTPFTYVSLIWTTMYGFLLFGDLPDRWTVLGALVIAGSGLYLLRQEARGRPSAVESAPAAGADR
jgi:drug/metabolite transporter (DMT)-like permease